MIVLIFSVLLSLLEVRIILCIFLRGRKEFLVRNITIRPKSFSFHSFRFVHKSGESEGQNLNIERSDRKVEFLSKQRIGLCAGKNSLSSERYAQYSLWLSIFNPKNLTDFRFHSLVFLSPQFDLT